MLSQAVYWNKRTSLPDSWFWKTQDEWQEETGLSRREQETARKILNKLGIFNERKKGIPAKLYYQINMDVLNELLSKLAADASNIKDGGKRHTAMAENDIQDGLIPPNSNGVNRHYNTETTTEITTETTKEIKTVETCLPVNDVFDYWKTTMNHKKSILDAKRKKLINGALKTGYSVDDLKAAILGCSLTPHNMGQNDRNERYDGVHIIFKDADNIERFIANSITPPQKTPASATNSYRGNAKPQQQRPEYVYQGNLGAIDSTAEILHDSFRL